MKKLIFEFSPLMALLLILAVVMPAGIAILPATPAMATVDNCFVTVSPTTAGVVADYTIEFDTTIGLTTAANDTVSIVFPTGTVIPSNVNATVNGAAPSLVTISAVTTVTLKVSANVSAGAVTVLFAGTNKITNPAAGSKTLTAYTSREATPETSAAYTIAGPVSTLTMVQQPTTTVAGQVITPAITVWARDAGSNNVSGATISVALFSGTGSLSGTASQVTNASGIATFNNLSINEGGAKILRFSSGLVTVQSSSFTITPLVAVTVTIPTTGAPTYAKTGGTVTVTFNATTIAAGLGDVAVQVLTHGTTTPVAYKDVQYTFLAGANTGLNWGVTLTSVAAGTYDVRVGVRQPSGTGAWVYSTVQSNAVVVDNTAPGVTLINPNGGNYVYLFSTYSVSWIVTDAIPAQDNVTVSATVSIDGGLTYPYTAFGPVTRTKSGSYSWTPWTGVPYGDYSTARLKLTVVDLAGNSTSVPSAANFYILSTPSQMIVSFPNSGTSWAGGSRQDITFTTTSALNLNVDYRLDLELVPCGTWSTITPGTNGWVTNRTPGLTTYGWTVPVDYRGTAKIYAYVRDRAGQVWSASPNPPATFTITDVQAPKVTVTGPNTGVTVYNNVATTNVATSICFTAFDNVTSICGVPQDLTYKWYLSTDGGSTWGAELPGGFTGAQAPTTPICQPWTPSVSATKNNCKIKVTATDGAAKTGFGLSNTFTIVAGPTVNPTINLSSPGSSPLAGGTCTTISWTASDPTNTAGLLEYVLTYYYGGVNYGIATLSNRDQGANSFRWAVPVTAGQYSVNVEARSPSGGSNSAPSPIFTVTAADAGVTDSDPILLYPGWNLVSLQLMPTCVPSTATNITGYPIESVLANVLSRVNSVWYFTGGASGAWQAWAPGAPSSLRAMTDGKAYWVYVTQGTPVIFQYQGRKGPAGGGLPATPYNYVVGWNMVGFKSTIQKTVQAYLGGACGTTYNTPVYSWDAANQLWTTPSPACGTNMNPGSGYWVNFKTAHTVSAGAD